MQTLKMAVLTVAFMCLSAGPAYVEAQSQPQTATPAEMVVIPKDRLTADQLAQLKSEQTMQQLESYSKWASMGRAIGIGVKETLAAVTDETARFAQTDVGRITVFLVAWKIMADDVPEMADTLIGYIVGLPLFLIGSVCVFWSYRRYTRPQRVAKEEKRTGPFAVTRTYEVLEPRMSAEEAQLSHGVAFLVLALFSAFIVFV